MSDATERFGRKSGAFPCGRSEKGFVVPGSRGLSEESPRTAEASEAPASFHSTPGLTFPEGAPGVPPIPARVGRAGPFSHYFMIEAEPTAQLRLP